MFFSKNYKAFCTFLIIITILNGILINGESVDEIQNVFQLHQVVPDVIAAAPNQFLTVIYSNGLHADRGVELTPTQVQLQPQVEWDADPSSYYTIILTDPDAPSRAEPKLREFKHWLVGNIPGAAVEDGEVIAAYIGSGPPKGTGLHRYVFLLYKQPGKIDFDEPYVSNSSRANRPSFRAAQFAEKYQLGEPVAANFYQAKWDEYVPVLHKQLSGDQ